MKDKEVINLLKSLKYLTPGEEWIKDNRSILYIQINNSSRQENSKESSFKKLYNFFCWWNK